MRERIAAAFVALTLLVLAIAGVVRAYAIQDLLIDREMAHLDRQVDVVAVAVAEEVRQGGAVDRQLLSRFADSRNRLRYVAPGGGTTVVTGADYAADDAEPMSATRRSAAGTITLSERVVSTSALYDRELWQLATLLAMLALLAGVAGWWLATLLSAPFQKLAGAATALGRGRFDLSLPRTRIPEARQIAEALRVTAAQMQSRVSRERDFAEHASHVLRTPLTSLRLELEDLTIRDDVPEDAKDAARRCMDRVDRVNASAGQLVALARSGSLVEGAETSLEELAEAVAQAWADRLAGRRTVTVGVEGDASLTLTPGPVEQILDLVLPDVRRGRGPVRVVFVGEDGHVRVRLGPGTLRIGRNLRSSLEAARLLAEAQGGRVTGEDAAEVDILLPQR